jgi:hypothetical protein
MVSIFYSILKSNQCYRLISVIHENTYLEHLREIISGKPSLGANI